MLCDYGLAKNATMLCDYGLAKNATMLCDYGLAKIEILQFNSSVFESGYEWPNHNNRVLLTEDNENEKVSKSGGLVVSTFGSIWFQVCASLCDFLLVKFGSRQYIIDAFACSRPKFLKKFGSWGRKHTVAVRKRSWV